MEFFNYTIHETYGTLQGLMASIKITDALLSGVFIAPIILLFVLLSVVKIANEMIVTKKYEMIGVHFIALAVFALLMTIKGTAKVWNIDLTKASQQEVSNLYGIFGNGGTDIETEDTGSGVTVLRINNVPLHNILLSVSDQLSFITAKTLLLPDDNGNLRNMQKQKLMTFPSIAFSLAFSEYIKSGGKPSETFDRVKIAIYCVGGEKSLRRMAEKYKETNPERYVFFNDLADTIEGYVKTTKIQNRMGGTIGGISSGGIPNKCSDEFFNPLATNIEAIADAYFNTNTDADKAYHDMFYNVANQMREEGDIPVSLKEQILKGFTASAEAVRATYRAYTSTREDKNFFSKVIERAYSASKYYSTVLFNDRTYNEIYLYKLQQIALVILFTIFPFVLTLGLLPAFGYNLKLIGTYIVSFFLVKLWIPIYILAFDVLTGRTLNAVSTVVAKIISFGGTAFAGGNVDALTFMAINAPQIESFTEPILNALAVGIPASLGGATLFMLGKNLIMAGKTGAIESMAIAKTATGWAKNIGTGLAGGIGGVASGLGSTSSGIAKGTSGIAKTTTSSEPIGGVFMKQGQMISESNFGEIKPNYEKGRGNIRSYALSPSSTATIGNIFSKQRGLSF